MPDDPGSTAKKVRVPESLESSLRANGARIASRYGNFVERVQARTASPGQNTSNLEFLKPRLTQQVVKRASWSDALTKRATVLPQTINMLQLRIPYHNKLLGLVWSRTNRARGLQRATAGMSPNLDFTPIDQPGNEPTSFNTVYDANNSSPHAEPGKEKAYEPHTDLASGFTPALQESRRLDKPPARQIISRTSSKPRTSQSIGSRDDAAKEALTYDRSPYITSPVPRYERVQRPSHTIGSHEIVEPFVPSGEEETAFIQRETPSTNNQIGLIQHRLPPRQLTSYPKLLSADVTSMPTASTRLLRHLAPKMVMRTPVAPYWTRLPQIPALAGRPGTEHNLSTLTEQMGSSIQGELRATEMTGTHQVTRSEPPFLSMHSPLQRSLVQAIARKYQAGGHTRPPLSVEPSVGTRHLSMALPEGASIQQSIDARSTKELANLVADKYQRETAITYPTITVPLLATKPVALDSPETKVFLSRPHVRESVIRENIIGQPIWSVINQDETSFPSETVGGSETFPPIFMSKETTGIQRSPAGTNNYLLNKYFPPDISTDTRVKRHKDMELIFASITDESHTNRKPASDIALSPVDSSTLGSAESGPATPSPGIAGQGKESDPEALAQEVYSIIKRRLAVEKERVVCM